MLVVELIAVGVAGFVVTVGLGLVLTRGKAGKKVELFELRCNRCGCVEAVENARVIRDPSCSDENFKCRTCAYSP